uniref:CARD domain-containing protein n=1 Tax=Poecilia reticulata TaxID=8081 RepID=A0A3P9PV91_POERE
MQLISLILSLLEIYGRCLKAFSVPGSQPVQNDSSSFKERCEELWERVEGVRHKLTRILNPAKLTPYLRQCKVIDEEDEDEVLNSTQYPLRISKAGRLLDILRAQGQRGLQAFMESLEFYHPEQYTQLTGKKPTHRCSLILGKKLLTLHLQTVKLLSYFG